MIAALFLYLLNACTFSADSNTVQFQTKNGVGYIDKLQQTKYILASNHAITDVKYTIDAPSTTNEPVDILILFDRTRSMKTEIAETAKAAKTIVKDIQKTAPNTRFAIAVVSDYSPLFTQSTDKHTWLLMADFTHEAKKIAAASNSIQLSNGGDLPEAYSRGLYEASMLGWRTEAKKIIIFFGDSIDHPIDPGRDEKLGTADDLTIHTAIKKLQEKNIHVIGIYTDNQPDVVHFFKSLSKETGGEAKALSNASSSADTIITSVRKELANNATLHASGNYSDWINVQKNHQGSHETVYEIHIKIPEDTAAGIYEVPLHFQSQDINNPLVNNLANTPMKIKIITGWYNHPIVLWLPLFTLLMLLAWHSIKIVRGGYNQKRSVTSAYKYNLTHYSMFYLVIDLLFYLSVVCGSVAIYLHWHQKVLSQIL